MNYKSQIGQDRWVCEFFNFKRDGFFLDIGAFDGVSISNTWTLEKELGWKGICIEAGIQNVHQCALNRNCRVMHFAVTDFMGQVNFHEVSGLGKITFNGEQTVDAVTMDYILKLHPCPRHIEYASLDVEGSEPDVLKGFPFDEYQVDLWTIEHNLYSDGPMHKDEIYKIMKEHGYIRVKEDAGHYNITPPQPFEDWYLHKSLVKL